MNKPVAPDAPVVLPDGSGEEGSTIQFPAGVSVEDRGRTYCIELSSALTKDHEVIEAILEQLNDARFIALPSKAKDYRRLIQKALKHDLPKFGKSDCEQEGFELFMAGNCMQIRVSKTPRPKEVPIAESQAAPAPAEDVMIVSSPLPPADGDSLPIEVTTTLPESQAQPVPVLQLKETTLQGIVGGSAATVKKASSAAPSSVAKQEEPLTLREQIRAYVLCGVRALPLPKTAASETDLAEKRNLRVSVILKGSDADDTPIREYFKDRVQAFDPMATLKTSTIVGGMIGSTKQPPTKKIIIETSYQHQKFADNLTAENPEWLTETMAEKAQELRKMEEAGKNGKGHGEDRYRAQHAFRASYHGTKR